MGDERRASVERVLSGRTGSLLDVGTGRGETIALAKLMGFAPVAGTEVVPYLVGGDVVYAEAHALPFADGSFDVVTCFDVLEHLLFDDQLPALKEFRRVAKREVIVTAANYSHICDDVELHVGRRGDDEWARIIGEIGTPEPLGWCGSAQGWRVVVGHA
jgi:SAM-dependent methyltransferase